MSDGSPQSSPGEGGGLTSGSIGKSLVTMAGPIFLGLFAFTSAGVVDAFFVAQLGTKQLAAMGFLGPVFGIGMCFVSSIGAGVQSVVSRAIGGDDPAVARKVTLHSLFLAMLLVGTVIGVGLALRTPVFRALGADASTMPYVEAYFEIWVGSLLASAIPTVAGSALVANGNSRAASIFYIVAAVLNACLDPLLIFGYGPFPAMGIEGAAYATLIGYSVVAVLAIVVLYRDEALRPRWSDVVWRTMVRSCRRVLRVAIPVLAAQIVMPVLGGVIVRVYSTFGDHVVAAGAASFRIGSLANLVPTALGMGLAAVVGQNWGAELRQRVIDAVGLSERASLVWGALGWAGIAAGSGLIAAAFVDDPQTTETLRLFLLITPASFGAHGVGSVCGQTLNAIDRASMSTVLSVGGGVASAIFALGAAFVAEDVAVVLFALVAADWASAAVAAVYVHRVLRTAEMGA